MRYALRMVCGAMLAACAAGAAYAGGAAGVTQRAGAEGEVRISILGPDGAPLVRTSVDVRPADTSRGTPPLPEAHVTTDEKGGAVFTWPAGEAQLHLTAHSRPGAYGTTGSLVVPANGTIAVALPPLVPLAHVEGTIPESVLKPGTEVVGNRSVSYGRWGEGVTVKVDEKGHFAMDLISGDWYFSARAGGSTTATGSRELRLSPGSQVNDLTFKPVTLAQPTAVAPPATGRAGATTTAAAGALAYGTVRDAKGQPVPHATVYVAVESQGGRRTMSQLLESATDDAGRYTVSAPAKMGTSLNVQGVYVMLPDQPLTWAYAAPTRSLVIGDASVEDMTPRATDIVLTGHAGSVDVRVLGVDGKPAADIAVVLHAAALPFRAAKISLLTARTDNDGAAHFRHVAPGIFQVAAASTVDLAQQVFTAIPYVDAPSASAQIDGVAVRDHQTTAVSLQLLDHPDGGEMRVVMPDGSADSSVIQAYHYKQVNSGAVTSGRRLTASGSLLVQAQRPGLWAVDFRYRDDASNFANQPPCITATGYFAVTLLLPPEPILSLCGGEVKPGSIEVTLRDRDQKPVRGYVEMANEGGQLPTLSGSTDAAGKVRFEAVPQTETQGPWNRYQVQVTIPGNTPLDLHSVASAQDILSDQQLRGQEQVLTRWVQSVPGQDIKLVLTPERVGYIRGKVLGGPKPDPTLRDQLYVYLGHDRTSTPAGAEVRYFPETGDYVAGPLAAGDAELGLTASDSHHAGAFARQHVAIKPGEVTHLDVQSPKLMPADNYASPFLDRDGRFNAVVFLADGKTPAVGAQVDGYFPNAQHPVVTAVADAAGKLSARYIGVVSMGRDPETPPADSPEGFVMVASLPGTCGSVLLPVPAPLADGKDPLKIVLPPAIQTHGKVTVEGRTFPLPGRVRVLAAYQGKGKLNPSLSIDTTANADGTFELSGLTPGHYQVQASLDDLWLSETVELDVTDRNPPPVTLKMAALGAPVRLKTGVPQDAVVVSRPIGPLTTQLAPTQYVADGAGEVFIPTLEAGEHRVHTASGGSVAITVPAVTGENAVNVRAVQVPGKP